MLLNWKLSWKGDEMLYDASDKCTVVMCDEMGIVEGSKSLGPPLFRETG